ncbi:MAG: hypothetical protein AMXMBFR33_66540 [Candidatus Xenobia bacterium]
MTARLAVLLFFLAALCAWSLYPPWRVELLEPVPDESKPTGFTAERIELHSIFWSPPQLSNAGPGRLTEDLESDPVSFRQSHIHWKLLFLGDGLILIGLALSLKATRRVP